MNMSRKRIKTVIVCVMSLLLLGSSALFGAKTKIMPLGDSITGTTCYPPFLWEDLMQNRDTNVVYVGTLITNGGQGVTCAGKPYYQPCEGHSGWNSSQIASGLPGWLQQTHPDIVVMHAGTNNFWNGASQSDISATLADYTTMVNAMRADNPNMKIIVAQIIPMDYTSATLAASNALDDAIPSWASSKTTTQSPIVVVDLRTGFDMNAYYADAAKVHPNSAGSKWMADRVFPILESMLGGVVGGNPPAVPALLFPPALAIDQTINPIVTWSDSTDGTTFRIQLSRDSSFSTAVIDQNGVVDTNYSVTGLSISTKYFWRVQAANTYGTSSWSTVWSFTTGSSSAFSYLMNKGWNLVSLPVIASNPRADRQLPYANLPVYEYVPDSGYVSKDTLDNGHGYWVKFAIPQVVTLTGDSLTSDTFSVVDGWNLIGSLSVPVPTNSIVTNGTTIISRFSYYNAGYVPSDTIVPSKAYWVKVSGAGTLMLGSQGLMKSQASINRIDDVLSRLNVMIVEDASGNNQRLYFGAGNDPRQTTDQYEMPPVPPRGAFDVRFSTGRFVELLGEQSSIEIPITISTEAYPVSIKLSGRFAAQCKAKLSIDGKEVGLGEKDSAVIADPRSRITLKLASIFSREMPSEFQLDQNYPNPFNPSTVIQYYLPVEGRVTLRIYNILGETVETLVNGVQETGHKSVEWNGGKHPSGVYYYRLEVGGAEGSVTGFTQERRMLLIK
jgi:hypothetical protein